MSEQAARTKLNAMIDTMSGFMIGTEFYSRVEDMDRDTLLKGPVDLSDWTKMEDDRVLRRDQGITWVYTQFTVPETCLDIPIAGTLLRAMAEHGGPMFAPLEVYVDGKLVLREHSWMDFKCPEGVVTQSAEPGRTHTLLFRFDLRDKSYWMSGFSLRLKADIVDENIMHLDSIMEELAYMATFEGTAERVARAWQMLDAAADTGLVSEVRKAEEQCRALFEDMREQVKAREVHLIAHAHIDMNWFWSMEETRCIVERDFTTVTSLMDEFPDLRFSQSQAATYQIARERSEALFKKMQEKVKAGQWDITASTWVEGDLNMSAGESLVRHMLYSKEYLMEHFGQFPRIMWCPDTFGHPDTLPQILKMAGIDRYFHMRIGLGVGSHEDTGFGLITESLQTPAYWWVGQDGSRVLTLNGIYNRDLDTRGILRVSSRFMDFECEKAMLVYGVGDHGGGPTRRDIHWVHEIQDYPTVPTIRFSTTDAYCSLVEGKNYPFPERHGEINFVFDGCYTTHADTKWGNRKSEQALQQAEALALMALPHGYAYPAEEFTPLWQRTLFGQFHDILDGSGVPDTYDFTNQEYAEVLAQSGGIISSAANALAGADRADGRYMVINASGSEGSAVVRIPGAGGMHAAVTEDGAACPVQADGGDALVYVPRVPAFGYRTVTLTKGEGAKAGRVKLEGRYYRIDTPFYEVEICKDNGQITTLYDRTRDWYVVRREDIGWRLKKGVLNELKVHVEEPTAMSSWTIGNVRTVHNLLDGAVSEVIADGDAEIRLRFTHTFQDSTIAQDIVLAPSSPVIRFDTRVDWQEWGDFDRDAPMLKAHFTPDVMACKAVFETPFGVAERHTLDREVPALTWADLADDERGFALMNDSKYGYKIVGNQMELTLIRSGWLPDPKSDVGQHAFSYAILPHSGDYVKGLVADHAQMLNRPLVVSPTAKDGAHSLLSLASDKAVLSGIKRSEDGKAIIARIYNPTGEPADALVRWGFAPTGTATWLNLLEEALPDGPNAPRLTPVDGGVTFRMEPRKIVSLRIPIA